MIASREGLPLRRAPLACLAAALAAAVGPSAASAAVETWPATPGEKVFPASARPADAAPGPVIAAARDEYEGAQIAIRSDTALEITPVVSDLTGPGTIPASSVELLRVGYVGLKRVSTGVDALEGDGRYPDPLFPVRGALPVPAGETTSLYVLVHVPAGAPAGRYTGSVELGAAGVVPLAVEVAPVTANRDGYTIVARLNQIQLAKASGVSEDDARFVRGVHDRLLPMLRAHGVSPGKPPHTAPKVDPATWALDYADSPFGTARRTNLDAFFRFGFPAVEVPFLPNFPQAGGEDRSYLQDAKRRTAARDFAAAYAPISGRTFALPVDEPNPRTYAHLNRAAAQLASASPRIPVLATEAPHPEALKAIGRSVDIWAPPIWDLFKVPKGVAGVRAKGKRVWWYTYGSDTQRYTPNVLIDKPTTEPRVMGWLAAKEGVEGFFYWGLNNWGGENYHSPFDDPWYLSHTKAPDTCGRGGAVGGNGEASLIYPTGDPSDPAIGSLRLEALRDGAEDHSLLQALEGRRPGVPRAGDGGREHALHGALRGRAQHRVRRRRAPGVPAGGRDRPGRGGRRPARRPGPPVGDAAADADRDGGLRGRPERALAEGRERPRQRARGKAGRGRGGAVRRLLDGHRRQGALDPRRRQPDPGAPHDQPRPGGPGGRRQRGDRRGHPGAARRDPDRHAADAALALGRRDPARRPHPLHRPHRPGAAPAPAGQAVTMTVGRRYHANGDEVVYPGNVSPSVDAFYPTGRAGRASAPLRNWSRYRFLEFTAEVLKRPPTDRAFHLIVTPGGHFRNASKVAVGNRTQLVRLSLAGLRGMANVRYLRFGVQSAVPKPWRGGHDLKVTLRVANMRLVP